ncbi:MAG: DNA mismatch repair protein MutS [Defluviitoga tunisiensis]|jgi:DNA mismatch repair protein MutS|uniref:DNA mismatch repair protein MutS n=1 Tax=Defluviitoga tunisiensis TaxID=1006576 RepID=A0A0C7NI12_DEFTU|nr:DNA mismatch repair protein MutS [Defluviitoga tunisiensis]MDD3600487.1 DNA mismatch repair protein MutS [Defluviitoga tunisiensis]MDY0379128.1 DNA mismatch repair protein MutS [Defluviitoga tunisiensis]CEP77611.1 DNA mismatch repair protein MutS [Defluviitoga tunisiensis]HHV00635.1 DNA mismatch repair protein MutS [Defluviitoga tunisiensis]HOP33726.1 DNA mismatch repair protein MutS [Defluviitoga tunisiensis]
MANLTPMIKQYLEIKEEYKDSILLFRLGDFYETFFDDAQKVSEILQIVLTKRNGHPMAGIPYHALNNYLKKLLDSGCKVAICEQVEDPQTAKGIVDRKVTRVLTPGTIVDDNMIDDFNRFSTLITKSEKGYILAVFDFSTGEFYLDTFDFNENELLDFINSFGFVQILLSKNVESLYKQIKNMLPDLYVEVLDDWYFSNNFLEHLKDIYKVFSLDYVDYNNEELKVADAVLKYLELTQFSKIRHMKIPKRFKTREYMLLDSNTIENLGILPTSTTRGKTLYDILKFTRTSMGHRKLRDFIISPLLDKNIIEQRFDYVEALKEDHLLMEELKEYFSHIKDLERISSRISLRKATPRDLIALKDSLEIVPYIIESVKTNLGISSFFDKIDPLGEVKEIIEKTICEEPSIEVGSGEVIKEGVSNELDEYRNILKNIDNILEEIEKREKELTKINSLKVSRNKVYGFYIEIPKTQIAKVPAYYTRKQTLVNTERFTIEELRQIEQKLSLAEDRIKAIEKELFDKIILELEKYVTEIKQLSDRLAELDVFRSFAEASVKYNYIRPKMIEKSRNTKIINGRHPVVERFVSNFIPNDLIFDEDRFYIILTGPNMSGKSTYVRQIGIISIMAQIGCFVPAEVAELPVYDGIFTRIGARDDIVTGKSTFLVEMLEMSTIINRATEHSLVLLDEVGRGTSTLDGISVAWAISEYLFQVKKCNTIFATHYTELTYMSYIYNEVIAKRIKVKETMEGVIFLHKIEDGTSDNSYGIEIAKLAGFPVEIVDRAREVLEQLSDRVDLENKLKKVKNIKKKSYKVQENQLKMF